MTEYNDPVVEVFSGTLWEAGMVQSLLENAEIESFLKNDVMNSYAYDPVFSVAVKVMIRGSDYLKAREVVEDYWRNLGKEAK